MNAGYPVNSTLSAAAGHQFPVSSPAIGTAPSAATINIPAIGGVGSIGSSPVSAYQSMQRLPMTPEYGLVSILTSIYAR